MTVLVRLRPPLPSLMVTLAAVAVIGFGLTRPGLAGTPAGIVAVVVGCVVLVVFCYPVVVSTVCRVPVIAISDQGIRLPLLGVRLNWDQVASISFQLGPGNHPELRVLLIYPTDPQDVVLQAWPWLRRPARRTLASYGTPIPPICEPSLDHSLNEIAAAIGQRLYSRRP